MHGQQNIRSRRVNQHASTSGSLQRVPKSVNELQMQEETRRLPYTPKVIFPMAMPSYAQFTKLTCNADVI